MKLQAKQKTPRAKAGSKSQTDLVFVRLPLYAQFIHDHRLRDFVREQLRLMIDMDFPMFRNTGLSKLSEEELIELSLPAHADFLQYMAGNRLADHLQHSITRWRSDKLQVVSREELGTEDISLSLYIRKSALLKFLPEYGAEVQVVCELVNEIDRYVLEAETRSLNTYLDIHHQEIRKVNRQLQRRTHQLLEAQQLANIGSFEWDLSPRAKHMFTPQVHRIFEMDDLTSPPVVLEQIHPGDREKIAQVVYAALRGKREFDCEFRFQVNVREKTIWARGVIENKDNAPHKIRGTVMDVTARQDMLRNLRRNEELYKQAEKLAHLGNWTYDLRTRQVTWSDELYRICNMTPQSKEITLPFFVNLIHPDDRPEIRGQMRRIVADLQVDYRLRVMLPGDETKHLLGKAEILKDMGGKPYKIIGTCQDITNSVKMTEELRQREENLAQLNASLELKNIELQRKNEELTSFNYVASHDLQEPLRKIKTFSDLVLTREKERLSDTGVSWLERISAAAGRLQKLIQDLLAFSRTQLFDDSRRPVDLNEVMATICSTYENDIAQGSVVIDRVQLPTVTGVPFQLHQLFENLIGNSVKYHREQETAHISITCSESEVISSATHPDVKYLKISVADNGIGFEQQYSSKIFEIFQRLHGQMSYSGTGIGLAICKKIAENHGGFIRASGIPGHGATFDVYFPQSIVKVAGDCSND